ncbi:MAG: ABC transporter ATP-binding protein, partial [Spirochaetota bacterium]
MDVLLEVANASRRYGGVVALQNVSMQVYSKEILGLIGPNGAGKTTLFNLITGMDVPSSGQIYFSGTQVLHGREPHRISRLGVARTFQNIRLFKELTVLENVMLGAHYQGYESESGSRGFALHAFNSLFRHRQLERRLLQESLRWLDFFGLDAYREEPANSLPYGKQRELEIARALASKPRLLFLDEPAAGMNPGETRELMENIRRISEQGITVMLIEHDMDLVMQVCERIIVLHQGQKIAEGKQQEIRSN